MIALSLTRSFGVITERKRFDTNVARIEQVLEVTTSTDVAVQFKDITVNVSDLYRLKTPSADCHKTIIAQIAVKFVFGRKAPFNVELVADIIPVVKLTLA
jgi:hypothetical protein